jgi:drug/metabolite transporter (DMT)-like permease
MMIFGSAFWAIVLALRDIPPITLGLLRALIAALFMVFLYLLLGSILGRKGWLRRDTFLMAGLNRKRHLVLVLGTAFFGTALPNIMQNIGMQLMDPSSTSSLASLIQGVGPVFTIFLAAIFLGERLGPWKIAGLVVAVPCTVVLTSYSPGGFQIGTDQFTGAVLNLMTAISYSIGGVLLKMVLNRGANPVALLGLNSVMGFLITLPVAIIMWILSIEDPCQILGLSLQSGLALFYISVCVYAVAAIIWYKVLRTGDLSRITFYVFLLPVFSVLLGYLLLGERLDLVQISAGIILLFGVWLSQRSKKDISTQAVRPPKV